MTHSKSQYKKHKIEAQSEKPEIDSSTFEP